jgi:hypothetical protein
MKNNLQLCTHDTHRSRLLSGAAACLMSLFLFCGGCATVESWFNGSQPASDSGKASEDCSEVRGFRVCPAEPEDKDNGS